MGEADRTEGLRVLVVDDQKVDANVYSALFKALGVGEVDIAVSGEEAVQFVQGKTYDLVLSDVRMPGMGGIGFVKYVRETLGNRELPVYAVTSDTASIDSCREQGFNAVLMKPFTRANVVALLRRVKPRPLQA